MGKAVQEVDQPHQSVGHPPLTYRRVRPPSPNHPSHLAICLTTTVPDIHASITYHHNLPLTMSDPYTTALAAIDAAHALDPTKVTIDGNELPYELHYAQKSTAYLEKRAPDARATTPGARTSRSGKPSSCTTYASNLASTPSSRSAWAR
jgi:hypothetical protein